MKKLVFAVAFLLIAFTASGQDNKYDETTLLKTGMEVPSFTVKMLDGEEISMSDLKGKVVLVNFWATWCPPCRQEFARVQKDIVERYKDTDFEYLLISRGEKAETVRKFMDKQGYTFPVGLDSDSSIYLKFANNYIPRNFVIGRDGKIVLHTIGYTPAEFNAMLKEIDALLGI